MYIYFQQKNNIKVSRDLSITFPLFTIMGMWGLIKPKSDDKTDSTKVLARADVLFDQGDYISVYNLLYTYKVIITFIIYIYVYVCVCYALIYLYTFI